MMLLLKRRRGVRLLAKIQLYRDQFWCQSKGASLARIIIDAYTATAFGKIVTKTIVGEIGKHFCIIHCHNAQINRHTIQII